MKSNQTDNAKGKKKHIALARLKKTGKVAMYESRNWKFLVTIALCSAEDVAGVFEENINGNCPEDQKMSPFGLAGIAMAAAPAEKSHMVGSYFMWVNTACGIKSLAALAHEAVHIAGMALSDRGAPCGLKDSRDSECVAYLVEDIVNFAVGKLVELGVIAGMATTSTPRRCARRQSA